MELECWADDNCMLIGEVERADESFDHALGREKPVGLEVKDFSVIVYIGGIDHDITEALKPEMLEYYKEKLLAYAEPIFEDAG